MKVAAIQSNYIPWKGYFDVIHDADIFVFYDEVKYTKNDWRNRNRVCTKNGLSWLTIPIPSSSVHQLISEVRITDTQWQEKHAKTLLQGYASAKNFDQLKALVQNCLIGFKTDRLVEINRKFIGEILKLLQIKTKTLDLKDFKLPEGRVERLFHMLKEVGASHYISGASAYDYLEPHRPMFKKAGIEISYKDYSGYPEYRQLAQPFEQAVSVLDLIANVPAAEIPYYIWDWRKSRKVAA